MSYFLNNVSETNQFIKTTKEKYFVDKTELIDKLNELVGGARQFVCITRPRRFGKSLNAAMLASYYAKNLDTKEVFDKFNISKCESYEKHLNKHNVIYMSLNTDDQDQDQDQDFETYREYKKFFKDGLISDLKELYPNINENDPISKIFKDVSHAIGEGFIFIIDEWDYIHTEELFTPDDRKNFSKFLTNMLKDQPYVDFAYMTGVLPIAKYKSGSSINMFKKFDALSDPKYGKYFGFTQSEVELLCSKQNKVSMDDLKEWYNGYINNDGDSIYNPMSVCTALDNGECDNYWGDSIPLDEIRKYIIEDSQEIRKYLLQMMSNQPVFMQLFGYETEEPDLVTINKILSLLVISGLLCYHDQTLFVPNKEVMLKLGNLLAIPETGNMGMVIAESAKLLKATIDQDADTVAKLIERAHDVNASYFEYNNENTLACVVLIAYFAAKDKYNIKKEDTSGKGRADSAFLPLNPTDTAFILELKVSKSVDEALAQIKSRDYSASIAPYSGKKLAVAICYDDTTKDKKHFAKIEEIK